MASLHHSAFLSYHTPTINPLISQLRCYHQELIYELRRSVKYAPTSTFPGPSPRDEETGFLYVFIMSMRGWALSNVLSRMEASSSEAQARRACSRSIQQLSAMRTYVRLSDRRVPTWRLRNGLSIDNLAWKEFQGKRSKVRKV